MTINKAIIAGRITKDIELQYSARNMAFTKFSVALDRYNGKDKENTTDFINCIAFGKNAESLSKYYGKGRKVIIDGNIKTGSYEKADGTKVYTTDVVVEKVDFADSKKNDDEISTDGFTPIEADDDLPF
jgi:single-strand DNA-binding protein